MLALQDKMVARERAKRRLVAARLRSQYKYRDPSKIPVNASPETEAAVKEHLQGRSNPFAQVQGK